MTGPDVPRSVLEIRPAVGAGPATALAVGLHLLIVGAGFVVPHWLDRSAPPRKPVIAHLVALGKPRDKSLLPRKESAPPPGAGPAVLPSTRQKSAPSKQPSRRELMERALARAAGRARTEDREPDPDREGQANGSVEGTATVSEAGDAYFTAVHDAIQANYVVPSVVSERERMALSATVLLYIGPKGQMLKHEVQKKSGNPLIDSALEAALRKTQLPPPPRELARLLRDEGVLLNFHP